MVKKKRKKKRKEGSSLLRAKPLLWTSVQHVALYYIYIYTVYIYIYFIVLKFPSAAAASRSFISTFIFPLAYQFFFIFFVSRTRRKLNRILLFSPPPSLCRRSLFVSASDIFVYSTHTQKSGFFYFIFFDWLDKDFPNPRDMMAATFYSCGGVILFYSANKFSHFLTL